MNQGKKITELEKAASVPDGSSYIVEMGDGTGTKRVLHEDMVKSVGSSLPLGETAELETRNRDNFVGAINELVQKMALVGIAYKGAYDPEAEYERLDAVFYEGSTFVAMKDGPEGPPTADVANWQYLAKGFMEGYLLAKSQLVNNLLATEPGNPLDAVQGKALADMISGINGNLGKIRIEKIATLNGGTTKDTAVTIKSIKNAALLLFTYRYLGKYTIASGVCIPKRTFTGDVRVYNYEYDPNASEKNAKVTYVSDTQVTYNITDSNWKIDIDAVFFS